MFIAVIISLIAGSIFGFGLGYMVGSDNGFVKGCEWSRGNGKV